MDSQLPSIVVFDVGGTTLQYTVGNSDGEFYRDPIEEPISQTPARQVARGVEQFRDEFGYDVDSVSISTAGPIVREKQALKRLGTPEHGELFDIEFGQALSEVGIDREQVHIENDTNAAVLAEYAFGVGSERGTDNLLYCTFSTGIGAGAVQDGEIHRGAFDNAGKLGSFPIVPEYDAITQKTSGCWEEVCAGKGIPDLVAELLGDEHRETVLTDHDRVSARQLYEAAKSGDEVAREYVTEVIGPLNARGIAVAAICYDPEVITLGGSIALNNPTLLGDPIRENLDDYYPEMYPTPDIQLTELGGSIELRGALRLPVFRREGQSTPS
jgi:glucokinase